jgi:hypothetical protein
VLLVKLTAKVAEAVWDEASVTLTDPAPRAALLGTVTLQGVALGSVPDELVLAVAQFEGVSVVCAPVESVNLKVSVDVAAKWLPVTVTTVPPGPPVGEREMDGAGVAPTPPPTPRIVTPTAVSSMSDARATDRAIPGRLALILFIAPSPDLGGIWMFP